MTSRVVAMGRDLKTAYTPNWCMFSASPLPANVVPCCETCKMTAGILWGSGMLDMFTMERERDGVSGMDSLMGLTLLGMVGIPMAGVWRIGAMVAELVPSEITGISQVFCISMGRRGLVCGI